MRTGTKPPLHARRCARPNAGSRPRRFIAEGTSAVSPDWQAWVMSEQLPYLGGLRKSTRPSSSARTGDPASPHRRCCRPARRRGEGRRTRPGPRPRSGAAGAAACGKERSRLVDSAGEGRARMPGRQCSRVLPGEHAVGCGGTLDGQRAEAHSATRETRCAGGVSCHVSSSTEAARAPGRRSCPPVL